MATLSRPHPAPRKRRQQRQYLNPLWRVMAGVLGCLLGLVLYVRWLSLPWSVGTQVSRDVQGLQLQWRSQRLENARLRQRLIELRSPGGIEALARSRGYHRPGEQVYLDAHTPSVKKSTFNPK